MKPTSQTRIVYRDSATGRFLSKAQFLKRKPNTVEKEHIHYRRITKKKAQTI